LQQDKLSKLHAEPLRAFNRLAHVTFAALL
jgi:hypothetical protein